MNRRTFIKSAGAAVAVITITGPAMAKTPEPQWIYFAEKTPKVGQKIIIASDISTLGMICGGTVVRLPVTNCGSAYTALSTIGDFYVGYYSDSYVSGFFYSEEGKEVISTRDWIRKKENIRQIEALNHRSLPHYGDYHKESYIWLSVNGEYPKTVPPIPSNSVYNYLENKSSDGTWFVELGLRRKSKFWKNRMNYE